MSNKDTDIHDEELSGKPEERAYHLVYLPEGEVNKEEWDVNQRRAYLLKEMKRVGLLDSLPVNDLADTFDVSRITIWKDKNILREWLANNLDINHEAEAYETFTHCKNKLMEEGNYHKAVKTQMEFSEWLEDRGVLTNENPDEVKVTGDGESGGLSIDFNVIDAPDEDEED